MSNARVILVFIVVLALLGVGIARCVTGHSDGLGSIIVALWLLVWDRPWGRVGLDPHDD